MFLENLPDLIVGSKALFSRGLQAAVDAFEFLRSCVVRASAQPGVNLQRDLCEFSLSGLRPSFDALHNVLKYLNCHGANIARCPLLLKGRPLPSRDTSGPFADCRCEAPPASLEEMSLRVLVPAFVISELKRAFEIGFLLFLPFLIIDLVVASVLMSMGMMMLPPVVVSLPFKLIFFVLVDGWSLVAGSLVQSYEG